MTIKNATQVSAVRIFLDPETMAGLNRARRRERQSAAVYVRSLLLRHLHEAGHIADGTEEDASR